MPEAGKPQRRRAIVLLGAPSGAGKTFLSREIIFRRIDCLLWLHSIEDASIARWDLKKVTSELAPNQVHIVECATQGLSDQIKQDLLKMVEGYDLVLHVSLCVPKHQIVQQYLRRIFSEPKRIDPVRRVLQISKYRNALLYLVTSQLERAKSDWESFGKAIRDEAVSRVVMVRVWRSNGTYHCATMPSSAR